MEKVGVDTELITHAQWMSTATRHAKAMKRVYPGYGTQVLAIAARAYPSIVQNMSGGERMLVRKAWRKAMKQERWTVWHDRHPSFGRETEEHIAQRFTGHQETFEKVAEVTAETLEEVFALSQHMESDWTKGPQIVWAREQPAEPTQTVTMSHGLLRIETDAVRSTSMGDVLCLGEGKPGDPFWVVAMMGFYQLLEEEDDKKG